MNGTRTPWALLASLLLSGCTPDPARTGPDALDSALAEAHPGLRGGDAARGVPLAGCKPHRMTVMASLTLRGDQRSGDQKVGILRTIDRGPDGAFAFEDQRVWTDPELAPNGYTDRRIVRHDGKGLAVKRGWGPWMERETLGGQPLRLLASAYDVAPTFLEGLEPHMRLQPALPGERAAVEADGFDPGPTGLEVQWVGVSLVPQGIPEMPDQQILRRLRDQDSTWSEWLAHTHRPTRVRGSIARTTGEEPAVVVGALEVDGEATVEGITRPFTLTMRISVEPLPGDVSFELPEDRLPATRDRPWQMIKTVLGKDLSDRYARRRPRGSTP